MRPIVVLLIVLLQGCSAPSPEDSLGSYSSNSLVEPIKDSSAIKTIKVDSTKEIPGLPGWAIDVISYPEFPSRQRALGISGCAKVEFTVLPSGGVSNPVVTSYFPNEGFNEISIRAAKLLRFKPLNASRAGTEQKHFKIYKFALYSEDPVIFAAENNKSEMCK